MSTARGIKLISRSLSKRRDVFVVLDFSFAVHLLSLNRTLEAFDSHGLRAQNDKLLDVQDMITILTSVYEILAKENPTVIDLPVNIDLIINLILNIYDRLVHS